MSVQFRLFAIVFVLVLSAAPVVRVRAQDATPTPDIHAQHSESSSSPTSDTDMSGMMSQMEDLMAMMDEMMGKEMPTDMQPQMKMMRGKMAEMMSGMQAMHGKGDMMSGGMQAMPGMDHSMPMTGTGLAPDAGAMEAMPGMDHSMPMTDTEQAPDPGMMDGMDHTVSSGAHAMAPVPSAGVPDATATAGAQPLDFTMDGDVKVFELTAQPVRWPLMDGVVATAWTYNGSVPGPMIRVTQGDRVRVILKNDLPEPTTIHWHGVSVPNNMDGVPGMTQAAVNPGERFIYEFTAEPAGTYWYHSHVNSDKQIGIGLYAPLIIEPNDAADSAPDVDATIVLGEWRIVDGETYPAMPMAGMEPNYFTVNGKAFPDSETIRVKKGERVRLRFINAGQFVHPMHLHGFPFEVVATDGHAVPEAAILTKDTIAVAPGERYDIEFTATETGQWMLHCHITHHLTNDGVEPGGLMFMIDVVE